MQPSLDFDPMLDEADVERIEREAQAPHHGIRRRICLALLARSGEDLAAGLDAEGLTALRATLPALRDYAAFLRAQLELAESAVDRLQRVLRTKST